MHIFAFKRQKINLPDKSCMTAIHPKWVGVKCLRITMKVTLQFTSTIKYQYIWTHNLLSKGVFYITVLSILTKPSTLALNRSGTTVLVAADAQPARSQTVEAKLH